MTIEITKPEVQALIEKRLRTGEFASADDVIFDALRCSELEHDSRVDTDGTTTQTGFRNLAELLANSPLAGADLDFERSQDYPRAVDIR